MDPIPFSDIYAEINDMVKPASQPDGLTLKDMTSCGMCVLCVCAFAADTYVGRLRGDCDWDPV